MRAREKTKEQTRSSAKSNFVKRNEVEQARNNQGADNRSFSVASNAKQSATTTAHDTIRDVDHGRKVATKASIKTTKRTTKTVQSSIKTAQSSIKTARRTIKTGQRTIKTAQKTAQTAAKTANATRKAAMLAQKAVIEAMKAAKLALQVTVNFTAAAIKALVAFTKLLIEAIVAGGWVAVVIIVAVALIAAILLSPIGIFYSGENKDSRPMPEIISEINTELRAEIQQIKADHDADEVVLDFEGDELVNNWMDVIAVFAVKTATDPEHGADVITLDDDRVERLKAVFWDMNTLSYRLETKEEVIQSLNPDGTTRTTTKTITTLIISLAEKSTRQMISIYNFNAQQKEALELLLSREFRPMFAMLISGNAEGGGSSLSQEQLEALYNNLPTGTLGAEIVRLALTRLGDPYSQALAGSDDYTDCSYFTRWCYQQVGFALPRTAAAQGQYCVQNNLTISPNDLQPGDLIFFSHDTNGRFMNITHVAIYVDNGMVVDASSSRGEVVYRKLYSGAVLYARPHVAP